MSAPSASKDLNCWNCGQPLTDVPSPISRHDHCPTCFEALHCCRLCRHFQPDLPGQCEEDRADPPVTKENANFCDWYKPRAGMSTTARTDRSTSAKAELAALFGTDDAPAEGNAAQDEEAGDETANDETTSKQPQGGSPSKADAARARLDSLFSKDD